MSETNRFVVTGASGFIGQALCAELARQDFKVRAYGRKDKIKFKAPAGVNYECVPSYLDLEPDSDAVCIHLAGENLVSGIPLSEGNLKEALVLADHLVRSFPRVIYASSAVVYGDDSKQAHREDDPVNIRGMYAEIKYAVERVVLQNSKIVARFANVYGPGMSKANVFSDILAQFGKKEPVKVRCIFPVRDFIHVFDVARGLLSLALRGTSGIYNVGTGVGTSIAELISQMLEIAGYSQRQIGCTGAQHSFSTLILDSFKMSSECGWKSCMELREGLRTLMAL